MSFEIRPPVIVSSGTACAVGNGQFGYVVPGQFACVVVRPRFVRASDPLENDEDSLAYDAPATMLQEPRIMLREPPTIL